MSTATRRNQAESDYPPIADYGLISDGRSMALVGRSGSIDWCCVPRVDSPSCFGRLLDWERGGYCLIRPVEAEHTAFRTYIEDTMVLATTFASAGGEARVVDCFTLAAGGDATRPSRLLRVVEGVRGLLELRFTLVPRFDYGEVKPWLRYHGRKVYTAVGGSHGLLISGDLELNRVNRHDLERTFTVMADERLRISIECRPPSDLKADELDPARASELDRELEATIERWRRWAGQIEIEGNHAAGVRRSALAIKALTNPNTGAIAAAATTSLPESMGNSRNWDYRFSWIRDSSYSVRSLAEIGCYREAGSFRRFIEESAAGSADELQIMYGVAGERRLTEIQLPLDGYRGSRPVRIGNEASKQLQLDAYGELLELSWRWHERGHSPDDDYWRFLVDLVDTAVDRWQEPDRGLWESRGEPQHYVHSKVMLWAAIDKGLRLAEGSMRSAPVKRWQRARDGIRGRWSGRVTTPGGRHSCRPSAARIWTHHCFCCPARASLLITTRG